MTSKSSHLPDSLLAVMMILWERGAMTMRELAEELYPGGGKGSIATVQKLLERLEEKEYVERKKAGRSQTFSATVAREEVIDEQLRSTAERFCGGSITPLFSRLIQATELTPKQCEELRALIDELDQQNKKQ